jgi:ATP-dependent RNA helicase RhlE
VKFESFQLHPNIMAGVQAQGYTTPTPIQRQAIPYVMQGRDVMGLAQTGTGKTAAFVLPILERLLQGPRGRVRALIIAPTRELAEQIHESIKELGRQTKLHSITVYGGVSVNPQIQKLRAGVEVVVACPVACSITSTRERSGYQALRCSYWTKRTGCSIWVSFPISAGS